VILLSPLASRVHTLVHPTKDFHAKTDEPQYLFSLTKKWAKKKKKSKKSAKFRLFVKYAPVGVFDCVCER
jgi:hypothetical protein